MEFTDHRGILVTLAESCGMGAAKVNLEDADTPVYPYSETRQSDPC
jgi:hypothetical protein